MTMLFDRIEDARSLAQIVVETVREPLLVLDHDLKILVASTSFHKTFQISPKETPDQLLFELDKGAWDIPALHTLLERSLVDQTVVEGFLVEQEFPRIGPRIFLLHARKVLDTKVGQCPDPAGLRGHHRPPRHRAGKGSSQETDRRPAAAERNAAGGNAAPHRQQLCRSSPAS